MIDVKLRPLQKNDQVKFLAAMQESRDFHYPWVAPPLNAEEFVTYFHKSQQPNNKSFLVLNREEKIVGVFNLNEIVHSAFQSAHLGFYAVEKFSNKRLMSRAMKLLLGKVFHDLELHRLEANIQPENDRSIRLVEKNGFKKEGLSPNYLKINDKWCDHERWAMTYEDYMAVT